MDEFDDNWLTDDILDAIDQQATQYTNTQQVPQPISISTRAFPQPVPTTTSGSRPVLVVNNGSTNRHHEQYNQTDQIIDNLRFTEDRLRLRLAHEENARESMHHELEQARSELSNLELVVANLRFEVQSLKKPKNDSSAGGGTGLSAATSPTGGKKSIFPDEKGFSDPKYNKRNTHTRSRQSTPAPGPCNMRIDRKRTAETMVLEKTSSASISPPPMSPSSTSTSPTSITAHVTTKKDTKLSAPTTIVIPNAQTETKITEYNELTRRLLGSEYNKLQIERYGSICKFPKIWSTELINLLCNRFIVHFNPPNYNNRKLAMLASDISDCMTRAMDVGVDISIQQLMNIFGHILAICVKEEMFDVLCKTVEVIHLLTFYDEGIQYILREFNRDEDNSMLSNLSTCFDLFDILMPENELQLAQHIPTDVSSMSEKELDDFFKKYQLTATKLATLIKHEASCKYSQSSINHILDIFMRIVIVDLSAPQSLHFLLRRRSFFKLLSINTPMTVTIKTLGLLTEMALCDGITKMTMKIDVSQDCPVSVTTALVRLLPMRQPSQDPKNISHWYLLRNKVINVLKIIVEASSISELVLQEVCNEISTPIQQMMYDECVRIQHISEPPFPAITFDMIDTLISNSLELIHLVVKHCEPVQKSCNEEYVTTMKRLEFAKSCISALRDKNPSILNKITSIEDLLKSKYKPVQQGSENNTMTTK